MVENVPFEVAVLSKEGEHSKLDNTTHQDTRKSKPWHTPLDSVGPVAASRKPTMTHALDMIQELSQPQYQGHGGLDARHSGLPEGENLMRRTVDYLNKNPR